jgi:methylmalonyl-CoA/ethylmalonyl-CoA epimerase
MTPDLSELMLGIDHVGIAVAELAPAIAFYRDTLGLSLRHQETNTEQQVHEAMLGNANGTQLQLLAPAGPSSPIARFVDRRGPGLQHVAYRVADVEAASQILRDRGLRLLYDAAHVGTWGRQINFIDPRDALGVLIEIVALKPPAGPTGNPPTSSAAHRQ